ncbi:MAG: CHASE domain-containing protein [Acidobacteriota bacterium]|nr:CHASE domain-containing protein [Acidobacteriota bacterium]
MFEVLEKIKNIEKNARFPNMVLVVSLVLTIGITYLFYKSAKSKDLLRFNNEIIRVQSVIENKVNLYLALLKGGRGFVESSEKLTRENFANYVKSLELGKNYVGVQGIGYNKIVLPDERETLIEQMKSGGYTDFKMFPESKRDLYQSIIYLEPLNERNKKAIGFDMSTEINQRIALEQARDSGDAATTAKVVLIQENEDEKQSGFLIYLPVYKDGDLPPTVVERKQNLEGYIFSPFRAVDFLNEVQTSASASDIAIKIYDGDANPANLLAQTNTKIDENSSNQINEEYSRQEQLDVSGRKWTVKYNALPAFAEQSSVDWTPFIFSIGCIFSFLLFGMTYWEASARAKLQITAAELFELEKQKQILLEKEQKARLSAERANNTKDEFIAVVSHELRTPLNAIAGWARILRTDNLSNNTKNLALDKIEKNLRSQTELVEELLDYSQIISGNTNVEDGKVNFSKVFENTFQEIEATALDKQIELIKDNKLNEHQIFGNEDKIKIVIYNLLSNAVKFTHFGGKVEASASIDDGNIQMIVKDNGKGISPDFLPHIFDRFQQADNSITRSHGGLGLGLAISHHIVKLHKGTIEANSEGIGKGAVFTVKFPFV